MSYSAYISGIVLANSGLCTVHGLAGTLGGITNVPHGVTCTNLLPHWLEKTTNKILEKKDIEGENYFRDKLYKMARSFLNRKEDSNKEIIIYKFICSVFKIYEELKIPNLGSYGVSMEELQYVALNGNNKNNPIHLNYDEKLQLLKLASK